MIVLSFRTSTSLRSNMACLTAYLVFLTISITYGKDEKDVCISDINTRLNYDAVMEGFDVTKDTGYVFPNPGFRDKIFEQSSMLANETVIFNRFVGGYHRSNAQRSRIKVIRDFDSYIDAFRIHKVYSSDLSYLFEQVALSKNTTKTSCKLNSEENRINCLLENGGEVIVGTVMQDVYKVGLYSSEGLVFKQNFINAIEQLHRVARTPYSETSRLEFEKFAYRFGTHYIVRSVVGFKTIFEVRFPNQQNTEAKSDKRRDCVRGVIRGYLKSKSANANADISLDKLLKTCQPPDHNALLAKLGLSTTKIIEIGSKERLNVTHLANPVSVMEIFVYPLSHLFNDSNFAKAIPGVNTSVLITLYQRHIVHYTEKSSLCSVTPFCRALQFEPQETEVKITNTEEGEMPSVAPRVTCSQKSTKVQRFGECSISYEKEFEFRNVKIIIRSMIFYREC